jgi:hypothetical protein
MSGVFVVEVERRSSLWVGAVQESDVFVQGRSLKDVEHSTRAALQLVFGDQEYEVDVRVRTERTAALAAAREQYESELVETARHLRASRVSWVDIRKVTGENPTKLRALLDREIPDAVDDEQGGE